MTQPKAVLITLLLSVFSSLPLLGQCNTSPTANPDQLQVAHRTVVLDVLANDLDPEGQPLTVAVAGNNCPADLTVDEFQLLTIDPNPRIPPEGCSFTYTISDTGGRTDTTTVTVAIIPGIFNDDFETSDSGRWSATID